MSYKEKKWDELDYSFLKTFYNDVMVITPSIYYDLRGTIWTTFHSDIYSSLFENVLDLEIKTMNTHNRFSTSYKNCLRGLHYDNKTWKLVQAIVGDVYFVVLDLRKKSKTYGMWESYILTKDIKEQILIPPGFANGHYALTDCVFHYTMFYEGKYVDVENQNVIKWNDKKYEITWPTNNPTLQKRDT